MKHETERMSGTVVVDFRLISISWIKPWDFNAVEFICVLNYSNCKDWKISKQISLNDNFRLSYSDSQTIYSLSGGKKCYKDEKDHFLGIEKLEFGVFVL